MSRQENRAVRLAVLLLPRPLRDRYSEQWTGELRDASSVGIPQSEIANGALRFAATVQRPMPRWFRTTSPRLSVALAFSAALISLSEYATIVPVTDGLTFTRTASIAATPLIAWVLLIPLVAFVLCLASRAASRRERTIVTLLAAASYLPLLRASVDSLDPNWTIQWLSLGSLTYAASAVLVAVATILAWREYGRLGQAHPADSARRLRDSVISGLSLAALVVACSIDEQARWMSRAPLVWAEPVTAANRAEHTQWLELKARGELLVGQVLTVWLVIGIVLAVAVVAYGVGRRVTRRRLTALTLGLAASTVISYGGLVTFLQLMSPSVVAVIPVAVVELIGRVGLIVVVLLFVGRADSAAPSSPAVGHDVRTA